VLRGEKRGIQKKMGNMRPFLQRFKREKKRNAERVRCRRGGKDGEKRVRKGGGKFRLAHSISRGKKMGPKDGIPSENWKESEIPSKGRGEGRKVERLGLLYDIYKEHLRPPKGKILDLSRRIPNKKRSFEKARDVM